MNLTTNSLADRLSKFYFKPIRRITQEIYDKKLTEYKEKPYDSNIRMEEYTRADENFHIAANTVFSLASRDVDIFESSEANEKRQMLNYLLQNCRLSGKNLSFELRAPFDAILEYAHHPTMLPLLNKLRTFNWKNLNDEFKKIALFKSYLATDISR